MILNDVRVIQLLRRRKEEERETTEMSGRELEREKERGEGDKNTKKQERSFKY